MEDKENSIDPHVLAEAQIKLYAAIYDRAKSYSSLVLSVGYAGFFALLSSTKPYLSKHQILIAAILMLTSLASFVSFEIYQTLHAGLATRRRARFLFDGTTVSTEELVVKIQSVESVGQKAELRIGRLWVFAWSGAVGTAVAAYVILLVCYIRTLLNA
jgi:hypothetical protein